jgi:hypothetical protein
MKPEQWKPGAGPGMAKKMGEAGSHSAVFCCRVRIRCEEIGQMRGHRFFLDNDVQGAARFFPERRFVSYKQAKLDSSAPDEDVIARSRGLECIIVTANGVDYEQKSRRFLRQTQKKDCHDLFGLVVIPNDGVAQARVLPGLDKRLRFNGKRITWNDVWQENYLVRVHSTGQVDVEALGRCFYCQRMIDAGA